MPNKKRNHLKSGVKHLPLNRVYPFNAADIRRQVMIEILKNPAIGDEVLIFYCYLCHTT